MGAAAAVALDEVCIVVSCDNFQSRLLEFQYGSAELTHDLPDEVGGHVGRSRHLVQACVNGVVVARTFVRKLTRSVVFLVRTLVGRAWHFQSRGQARQAKKVAWASHLLASKYCCCCQHT